MDKLEFVSMEKVAQHAVAEGLLPSDIVAERVHTAYGMSKDFGMNGFRVGCLHTKNADLLEVGSAETPMDYAHVYTCVYMCVYVDVCICICICICIYAYIYVYVHV